jgi:hypothetical protein
VLEYLRQLYPLLRRQYYWFKKTQYGDTKSYDREVFSSKEAYRWRGRTVRHVLTSGLDDYPRPQPPHPGELHVDLMSWMGMMTKSLINIASALGLQTDVEEFTKNLSALERNLDDLHWSETDGCYCDATIDDFEENKLVCHKGYISLFPFLTGVLKPDNPKLGKLLDLLGDEEELWSPHGIRSLSKKDELYGTDENYWRSPVWININYMAISQLYVCLSLCCTKFNSRTDRLPNTEHRDAGRPLPEAGARPVRPAAEERRRHGVQELGGDGLRVGAVQPRDRPWPADAALHGLDEPRGQDHGHGRLERRAREGRAMIFTTGGHGGIRLYVKEGKCFAVLIDIPSNTEAGCD